MSKRKPQVEDAIIKEFMIEAFKWSVLILFVLSLCLVGYLISENEQLQNEKQMQKQFYDSIYIGNKIVHELDSINNLNSVDYLPTGWEVDSNGIYNINP